MNNLSVILMLFAPYAVMLLLTVMLNKKKPGIALYNNLQPESLGLLNYLHAGCIMIMLLPALVMQHAPVFLLEFPDRISLQQAFSFLVFFGVIGLFPWKKFENKFPGIEKASCLTSPDVIAYSFLRIIFLAVYEWFFRGLMLTEFTTWLGMTGGIVINILLYALIHSHKDKKEILGSVPLGMVLCVFTLWWHSIWPAVIFHLEIAFINESPVLQKFISPKKQAAL